MNSKYIPSANIKVFPCANRSVNIESKLNTEFNFTHIPSVAGLSNCILHPMTHSSGGSTTTESHCEFVINGYYFDVLTSEVVPDSDWDNNIYAVIILENIVLVSGADGYKENSTRLARIVQDSDNVKIDPNNIISGTKTLKTLDNIDTSNFEGLLLTDTEPANLNSATGFKVAALQLKASGQWVNEGPLLKGTKLNNIIISDSEDVDHKLRTSLGGSSTSESIRGINVESIYNLKSLNGTSVDTTPSTPKLILGKSSGGSRVNSIAAENLDVSAKIKLDGNLNGTYISTDTNTNTNKLILGDTVSGRQPVGKIVSDEIKVNNKLTSGNNSTITLTGTLNNTNISEFTDGNNITRLRLGSIKTDNDNNIIEITSKLDLICTRALNGISFDGSAGTTVNGISELNSTTIRATNVTTDNLTVTNTVNGTVNKALTDRENNPLNGVGKCIVPKTAYFLVRIAESDSSPSSGKYYSNSLFSRGQDTDDIMTINSYILSDSMINGNFMNLSTAKGPFIYGDGAKQIPNYKSNVDIKFLYLRAVKGANDLELDTNIQFPEYIYVGSINNQAALYTFRNDGEVETASNVSDPNWTVYHRYVILNDGSAHIDADKGNWILIKF